MVWCVVVEILSFALCYYGRFRLAYTMARYVVVMCVVVCCLLCVVLLFGCVGCVVVVVGDVVVVVLLLLQIQPDKTEPKKETRKSTQKRDI